MTENRIGTRRLPNGLSLEVRDDSRRVAGDRHLVCLRFSVAVPIRKEYLEARRDGDAVYDALIRTYGPEVRYEAAERRHFVAESELEAVRSAMMDVFFENTLPYLSRPDFARRLVLRKVREMEQNPVPRAGR